MRKYGIKKRVPRPSTPNPIQASNETVLDEPSPATAPGTGTAVAPPDGSAAAATPAAKPAAETELSPKRSAARDLVDGARPLPSLLKEFRARYASDSKAAKALDISCTYLKLMIAGRCPSSEMEAKVRAGVDAEDRRRILGLDAERAVPTPRIRSRPQRQAETRTVSTRAATSREAVRKLLEVGLTLARSMRVKGVSKLLRRAKAKIETS